MLQENIVSCLLAPGLNDQAGVPTLIWGPPGIGKTAILQQLAEHLELPLEVVILSIREPSEVAGIPFVSKGEVKIAPPLWAQRLIKKGEGIVFFDELTTAPPSVQAAALRIILDRVVGDTSLPKNVRIIAAANQTKYISGGWNLTPPLANRFIHLEYRGPSPNEWADWLLTGSSMKETPRSLNPQLLNKELAKMRGLATTFLTKRDGGSLGPTIPGDPELASKGWPSPRSWEMAIRAVSSARTLGHSDHDLLCGSIGPGVAKEFKTFEAYADLPDPQDLIDGKTEFTHNKARLDRTVAVLSTLASYAIMENSVVPVVWKLIGKISKSSLDVAVPAVRTLMKAKLFECKEGVEVVEQMSDIMVY